MIINFANPTLQNIKIKQKLITSFKKLVEQKNYLLDIQNKKFENNLKKYFNIKYVVGVKNGTDALKIALMSLNLKKNDEIIIPSLTATATGSAVLEAGAKPVFVDVDMSANINVDILKKKISTKTKAIIAVHLHGNIADVEKIKKIIGKKIILIEDCAQSFGSKFKNKYAGTFGKIGCFSFYPTKNLSAIGDGGAIITNDKILYKKFLLLRQYGWNDKRISIIPGFNSRLDEIQASILNIKIGYINKNNILRNKIAKRYIFSLSKLPIKFPIKKKYSIHCYHLFVIMTKKRDKLLEYLKKKKIFASIHYKYPLHLMPTFKKFKKTSMQCTNVMCKEMISLPIYPELTLREQNKVIAEVTNFFKFYERKKHNFTTNNI